MTVSVPLWVNVIALPSGNAVAESPPEIAKSGVLATVAAPEGV